MKQTKDRQWEEATRPEGELGWIRHLAPGLGRSAWNSPSALHGCLRSTHHSSATLPDAWKAQLRAGSILPISQKGKQRQGVAQGEGYNQERTQAEVCPPTTCPWGPSPYL